MSERERKSNFHNTLTLLGAALEGWKGKCSLYVNFNSRDIGHLKGNAQITIYWHGKTFAINLSKCLQVASISFRMA